MQELLDDHRDSSDSTLQSKLMAVLGNGYERLPSDAHRLMFLDAALLLRGCPSTDLTALWEGQLLLDDSKGEGPSFGQLPARRRGGDPAASQVLQQTRARKKASELLGGLENLLLIRRELYLNGKSSPSKSNASIVVIGLFTEISGHS